MSRFIYKVNGGYGSPKAANGCFATPRGATAAVTKQAGVKLVGAFSPQGIEILIKAMKVGKTNTLSIAGSYVEKVTLRP